MSYYLTIEFPERRMTSVSLFGIHDNLKPSFIFNDLKTDWSTSLGEAILQQHRIEMACLNEC